MALMRDARAEAGRLTRPHLGRGDLEGRVASIGGPERIHRGDARRRRVIGEQR